MVRRLAAVVVAMIAFSAARGVAQPLAPSPYTPPAPGTRYVYTNFANTVTKTDGWRTYFTDEQRRPGANVGVFIPDNPRAPLTFDTKAMAKLWPLRVGAATDVDVRRDPLVWRWSLTVVDTQTVSVPAGRFKTYVVQAIETPRITASRTPNVNITTFWYAPEVNAVVRFRSGRFNATGPAASYRQELLRIEGRGVTANR